MQNKRQHRSGHFCKTFIIYICSLLESIGNWSMYNKDWDSNKRNQRWNEALLTHGFRCSLFPKTRWCPVQIQIQRIHTHSLTKSRWRLLGMKWWHCGCRSTCVAQPQSQGSSQRQVLPHLEGRRIITPDLACSQCDMRFLEGEDTCQK